MLLEERLVKCGYDHQEFSNIGRNALKKKVHELETVAKAQTTSINEEVVSEEKEDQVKAENNTENKADENEALRNEVKTKDDEVKTLK